LSAPTVRATTRQAKNYMSRFTYIYILQSQIESERVLHWPHQGSSRAVIIPIMQGTSVTQEDGNRGAR